MTAEVIQIRDFQRPEERLACDKRLGYGIPTIYLTTDEVDAIAKYADFRDSLTQAIEDTCIPPDYDPRPA